MIHKITPLLLTMFLMVASIGCNTTTQKTVKVAASDPFINTIVSSQLFTIDTKIDNVVEGNDGTTIICPTGCFKNSKGEIVEGNVRIELAEALSLDKMIFSNLTTTSDGKLLETDGMIYFNATLNGEQLTVNTDKPVHIDIPTLDKKPGMMVYEGIRDSLGNMNWISPQPIDNFLTIVNLDSLDFLPKGFQEAVGHGMPYKNYKTVTKKLADSLYYSLALYKGETFADSVSESYNEPYYNAQAEVKRKKYTSDSYTIEKADEISDTTAMIPARPCGINPAIIKLIQSEKYQNTFIATKEFEARLQTIFKSCNDAVLEIYLKNLDKNLYEVDSMAAVFCENKKLYISYHEFDKYSKLRQTKVKDADKYASLLKAHYKKNLAKIKHELEKNKAKIDSLIKKGNESYREVIKEYKEVLWKREKYRMQTYGFTWTKTGWINIDNGTLPKDWNYQPLEVTLENGDSLDRVYTYAVYKSIKSLYRLNAKDKSHFYVGNSDSKEMIMPNQKEAIIISIGYKNDILYFGGKSFETGSDKSISYRLEATTPEELRHNLSQFDEYASENKISQDLIYMEKMYKEEQRQKVLQQEQEFIRGLYNIAFPCCNDNSEAALLFKSNCSSCHAINIDGVGPALASATNKYSADWLYKWTTNSSALISSGDPQANDLYIRYGKSVMTSFGHLTKAEVAAIYRYIDSVKEKHL